MILIFEATVYQVIQSRWNKSTLEQTEDKNILPERNEAKGNEFEGMGRGT